MSKTDLIAQLAKLVSENQNPDTMDIDLVDTVEVVRQINRQDKKVALAVEKIIPEISLAVDVIVNAFNQGGRLVYIGAGTSGRIGVLDAV